MLGAAIDWGYESQAAFTRAFSRAFGVTPAAFARRSRAGDPAIPLVFRAEPRRPFPFGPPPEPRFEERPAFRAVGLGTRAPTRRYQSFVDIPAFWDDWLEHRRWLPINGAVPGRPHYGLIRAYASGEIEYVIALEVAPGTAAPRGYRAVDVPAGTFAVFTATGEPSRTAQTLALGAFGVWLPTSKQRLRAGAWEFEAYHQDSGLPPGVVRCEVGVPLVAPLAREAGSPHART